MSRFVDRCRDDGIASAFLHRDAFPCDGGLINIAIPFGDHAIHRNALPRLNHNDISGNDLLGRNDLFHAIPDYSRRFWRKVHKFSKRIRGFGF